MDIISFISKTINLPEDQVRGFTITILSLIVSLFLPKTKLFELSTFKRQCILISLGISFQKFMFGNDLFLYHLLPTIFVYYLIKKTQLSPAIIFLLVMGYNLSINIERMITRYGQWDLKIDSAIMIWMQNVSSVAWDFREGKIKKDNFTLMSFLEYVYFYIYTCFGPFVQYSTLQDYFQTKGLKGNVMLMFRSMLFYIVLVILYIQIEQLHLYTYITSEDFEQNVPYILKVCLMIFAFVQYPMIKYPGAWSALDMNVYLSGIGYSTEIKDGKVIEKWDKVQSVKLPDVFIPYTQRDFIQAWNVSAQFWLKEYIFHKIVPIDKIRDPKYQSKIVTAELMTFLVSGIWHGLYPGYIIFFTCLFFTNQIWKHFFKYRNLYFNWINIKIGKVCSYIILMFSVSYCSSCFLLLEVNKFKRFYQIIGYWPFILILCLFFFTKYQDYSISKRIIKNK